MEYVLKNLRNKKYLTTTSKGSKKKNLSNKKRDKPAEESEEQFFTEVHYGKRQRSSPEAVMRNQKQTKLNYWLAAPAVPTSNSFTGLDELELADKPETQTPKPIRPPPLFIDGVKNIQPLLKLLEDIAKGEYEIKVLRGDKSKQDRSFRVVLKNLHPSTDKEDIKIAVEELNHKVINVWNIQNSRRKQALSMCNIKLEPRENNKDI
uniref:SFRICE_014931 n=1 Tax=Spodoptera frugiperda TaxID=7108 RepID=A0A2H1VF11_SPOFR